MKFIGIDIGTSSICGVLYDVGTKEIEYKIEQNDANIITTVPWEKIQDPDKIVTLVMNILHHFCIDCNEISGIGITGQMHGILYLDSQGNAISPLYTWQDKRADQSFKDKLNYSSYLSENSGLTLPTGYGLVTHFYNVVNKIVPKDVKSICTIMDYVVLKLSHLQRPVTDYSNAASLGFFDVEHLSFHYDMISKFSIDTDILPTLKDSSYLAGYWNTIPVFTAIGDNQSSFLGSVSNYDESIQITIGTSSQISVYSKSYLNIDSLDIRPLPGGGYILVGACLCGGYSLTILKSFFSSVLSLLTDIKLDDGLLYSAMATIPYMEDLKNALKVETTFEGTRHDPYKRGSISNIYSGNFNANNLIFGFLRGMSDELYNYFLQIPSEIRKDRRILCGSGNGLKKNPLLCRVLEDTFNAKMHLSKFQEEAALGACINSMVGSHYLKKHADFFSNSQV
jgi:sedoheptulokinase